MYKSQPEFYLRRSGSYPIYQVCSPSQAHSAHLSIEFGVVSKNSSPILSASFSPKNLVDIQRLLMQLKITPASENTVNGMKPKKLEFVAREIGRTGYGFRSKQVPFVNGSGWVGEAWLNDSIEKQEPQPKLWVKRMYTWPNLESRLRSIWKWLSLWRRL